MSLQERIKLFFTSGLNIHCFANTQGLQCAKMIFFSNSILGRIWKIATVSFFGAAIPVPGVSIAADITLLTSEMKLYRSQLGLPEENSPEFLRMSIENQAKIRKFCITSVAEVIKLLISYAASSEVEVVAGFIPILGIAIAGSVSFSSTYYFLHRSWDKFQKIAMDYLDEVNTQVGDDLIALTDD